MSSLRGLVWHDIYHKSVIKAASEIILESETGTSPEPELQSIVYYLHLLLSRQLLEKRIIYINNISQLFTITFASFFLGNSFLLPNSASPFITWTLSCSFTTSIEIILELELSVCILAEYVYYNNSLAVLNNILDMNLQKD